MASIYDWSTTAGSNGNSDSAIDFQEGQAPSTVNNSSRAAMGRIAELLIDLGGSIEAGGTANGLTVTASSAFTTLVDGRVVAFRGTADNTGAATLNVNSVGAKAIRKFDSSGDVALVAGEIQDEGVYIAMYSEAVNSAAGGWVLLNPTLSAAVYALSGLTSTDNAAARFDSTAGKLQNSGVIISDSNAITGAASLTVSGAVTAGAGFVDSDVNCVLAATGTTGSIFLRPQGVADTTNQTVIAASTGNMTVTGTVASGGDVSGTTGTFSGTMTANAFSGTGTSLTALNASNLGSGTVPDARFPATLPAASGVNLTALNATNLASGTVASARVSGSYTGITGTGALAAGSIASTFGNINVGSSTVTGGAASFTSMASSGQVTGTTAVFSSTVTGTVFTAAAATNTIIASPTTNMLFRPSGAGSSTGQITLAPGGDVTVSGDVDVTGSVDASNSLLAGSSCQVGTYSGSGASNGVFIGSTPAINSSTTSTGSVTHHGFVNGNGGVGSIVTSGTATAYNTSSDGRRKKNLRDFDGGGFIDALEVWLFDWIAGGTGYGVIAQDALKVFPDAITEGEDGFLQADYSKFVPLLLAEVKALRARVAALEA